MQIFQVDAFTRVRYTGNPATVILDADDADDPTLAAIAREFPHAETAFVFRPGSTDHEVHLRFFNARKEAPFVGHATLAAHAVLLSTGRRSPGIIRQRSGTGILEVKAMADQSGRAPYIEFRQGAPSFDAPLPADAIPEIAACLGLEADAFDPAHPAGIARKGSSRLLLPLRSFDSLQRIEPRFEQLTALGARLGTEGFFVFGTGSDAAGPCTRSRMFCPALGIPEDPVSGNAHAMLAAFLWNRGLLDPRDPRFTGYQGEHLRRPGQVQVTLETSDGHPSAARIGGHAVIVSRGEL